MPRGKGHLPNQKGLSGHWPNNIRHPELSVASSRKPLYRRFINGLGQNWIRHPQTLVNSSHLPGTRHPKSSWAVLLIHKHLHVTVQVLQCSKNLWETSRQKGWTKEFESRKETSIWWSLLYLSAKKHQNCCGKGGTAETTQGPKGMRQIRSNHHHLLHVPTNQRIIINIINPY